MSWLTKIALKQRWLTFLIATLVIAASIWGTVTLKQELIPDIALPVTSVGAIYPQASPGEVMDKVTVPIEGAIADIEGLKHLYSTATAGMSMTIAQFEFGTDMDEVNSIIGQNLSELNLPPEVRELPAKMPEIEENPRLFPIDINMMPVVWLGLSGDLPPDELQEIAISQIKPQLEIIKGVYHVDVEGGSREKILVTLDPEKMNQSGISVSQVVGILTTNQYHSLSEVENTATGTDAVILKDIAGVKLGLPPETALSRTNSKPSVSIMVMKEAEANTVEVANAVVAEAERIQETLGNKVELVTVLDQSEYIEESISDLTRNAVIGFILAAIIVFLFLMVFRASIVTAISIPLSILLGFLAMRGMDLTINILTLSAMAIAVGRVIDNSIVVLEVIYRRMQQGEGFKEAAISGVEEVASPITSTTIATIVIFIPLAWVGGIVGELFIPFAWTITFALIASLLIALTVVPALSKFHVSRKAESKKGDTWYQRLYTTTLKWSLTHRAAILSIAMLVFLGSFALLPIIGTAFIPGTGEKVLMVNIEMPTGTDLVTTEEAAMQAEEVLDRNPNVLTYQTTVGTSTSLISGFRALMAGGSNTAYMIVFLDSDADLEQEVADLRKACEGIAEGAVITVGTEQLAMAELGVAGLSIFIRGESLEDVANTTNQLLPELEKIDGVNDLKVIVSGVEPGLTVKPDMARLMALGLPMEQLQQLEQEFYLMVAGGTVIQANIDGKSYDVFLEGMAKNLDNVDIARKLRVGYSISVPLGDIATVELVEQPTSVQHIDRKLAASISGTITAKDVGAVNQVVQEKIDALALAPGVEVTAGGIADEMALTFSSMYTAIAIAILLAYAVLVVAFRSFLNPFIIMGSLPLATIGAWLGLLIAGKPLGISALMGILMLVGIVLTNAVVLLTLVEQLRKEGMSTYDALVEAGRTRLRPILMTALTTMIALVPLALGLGAGVLMAAELAVVVIGGLFTSTLLTLLVIPVVYSLFRGGRQIPVEQ